jgi:hypothetical protein
VSINSRFFSVLPQKGDGWKGGGVGGVACLAPADLSFLSFAGDGAPLQPGEKRIKKFLGGGVVLLRAWVRIRMGGRDVEKGRRSEAEQKRE